MKKNTKIIFISICLLIILSSFSLTSCLGKTYELHFIMNYNDEVIEKTLEAYKEDIIENPKAYKFYDEIAKDYVILEDKWYTDNTYKETIRFPYSMPKESQTLYAKIRPLTKIKDISLKDSTEIEKAIQLQGELKDEDQLIDPTVKPNIESETSYYEIKLDPKSLIPTLVKYYPATKKLYLVRAYTIKDNIDNYIAYNDTYGAGLLIDFNDKSFKFKGMYTRQAFTMNSVGGGQIELSFDIDSLSIDDPSQPLVPNLAATSYTHKTTNATNSQKMYELFESDENNITSKCYQHFNPLLANFNTIINIFN